MNTTINPTSAAKCFYKLQVGMPGYPLPTALVQQNPLINSQPSPAANWLGSAVSLVQNVTSQFGDIKARAGHSISEHVPKLFNSACYAVSVVKDVTTSVISSTCQTAFSYGHYFTDQFTILLEGLADQAALLTIGIPARALLSTGLIVATPLLLPLINYYLGCRTDKATLEKMKESQENENENENLKPRQIQNNREKLKRKVEELQYEAQNKSLFSVDTLTQLVAVTGGSLYMISGVAPAVTAGTFAIGSVVSVVAGKKLAACLTRQRAVSLEKALPSKS